ncbi:ribose 5-phosphate isomerase A-domain-containing protein [Tribonema minus]|uniref:ribose-5-phosphate isomerase n=1 Tax=Tribonema minus TaxID=303371 RepID=A0A836CI02_9STRA|nr:ribose 5-phosphate isomerase A-domain-containing protein [Tribonema minus]
MQLQAFTLALLGCAAGSLAFTGPVYHSRLSAPWARSSGMRMMATQDELKQQVGYKAVDDYVKSGMVVGLGTGSTAAFAVERLGQLLKDGTLKDIIAIPTSIRTKEQAEGLGIPLTTLDSHPNIDVAIDGADTVDNATLALVKGGGGALLREKIVEVQAKEFIVIVDESKMADGVGPHFDLPVEIIQFCHEHIRREVENLPSLKGCKAVLRMSGDKPYVTDNANYIVDCKFDTPIKDPVQAGAELLNVVGVVEHGLFLGMTTACIIAGKDGISVKTP